MKRILFSTIFICLVGLCITLLSNGPAATTPASAMGGTFSGYITSEPDNLDPARGVDVSEANVQSKIFDGLVSYDEKMNLYGNLAETWTVSPDGKEYVFNLRENIKFHCGQPLTARDVVFSFDRIFDPQTGSPRTWVLEKIVGTNERLEGETTQVSGIEAIDDHKVKITLETPFAPFISLLTMPACYILPSGSAASIKDRTFFSKPSGTGPYRLTERVRDSYIKLEAYSGYHGQKAMIAAMELRIIPEPMSAEMEFESGNLDILQLHPSNYERMSANPTHADRITDVPALNVYYVGFNNQVAPFNDKRVRQALNMLIDRDLIIKAMFQGRAVPARGSIPPGILGHSKDAPGFNYNPEKAAQLLKEAGFDKANPLSFSLFQRSSQAAFEITRLIQGELKKHGIKVELKPMEWSALRDSINKGEAPAFYISWFGDYPDGENFLFPLFHSSNWGSGGNRARFKSAEVDSMIEEAVKIQDEKKRAQAYDMINRKVTEMAPWLYLWHSSESYLTSSNVKNLDFSPMYFCDKGLSIKLNR